MSSKEIQKHFKGILCAFFVTMTYNKPTKAVLWEKADIVIRKMVRERTLQESGRCLKCESAFVILLAYIFRNVPKMLLGAV